MCRVLTQISAIWEPAAFSGHEHNLYGHEHNLYGYEHNLYGYEQIVQLAMF